MSRMTTPLLLLLLALGACGSNNQERENDNQGNKAVPTSQQSKQEKTMSSESTGIEVATFGAGCYWCIEAVLQQVDGITKLESGFMGGHVNDPSYREVCMGTTGHAEVVRVHFDPSKLQYRELLGWFWKLHDPTTLNRQGNDVGTQYRSAIFYHSPEQKEIAEDSKVKVGNSGAFTNPIVTEITEASKFWKAKDDHQDYYRRNKSQGYCRAIIAPKLKKLGLDY